MVEARSLPTSETLKSTWMTTAPDRPALVWPQSMEVKFPIPTGQKELLLAVTLAINRYSAGIYIEELSAVEFWVPLSVHSWAVQLSPKAVQLDRMVSR